MQTTVAAHATTAIILSTIITTSHHHISASYIVTDRLSPGDAACPGTSYNIYNCEWIKIYTSGVFFVISVMTDVYVIASRRTVRLRSPILPIGSLSLPMVPEPVEGAVISKTAAGRLRYCKPWRRLYFLLVLALHFHQFLFIPLFLKVCCVFDRKEFCEHGIHHGEDLRQGDFFITCE